MILRITGDLFIPDVAELHQDILPCLGASEYVSLDLRDVGEVDTAGLQLLLCVSRSATTAGNRVTLDNITPGVELAANKLGLNLSELSTTVSGGGQCPE